MFAEKTVHLGGGVPPEIMVSFADQLFARQGIQKRKIAYGFLQCGCPGNVPGADDIIFVGDDPAPVGFQARAVICPAHTEFFHGFICLCVGG